METSTKILIGIAVVMGITYKVVNNPLKKKLKQDANKFTFSVKYLTLEDSYILEKNNNKQYTSTLIRKYFTTKKQRGWIIKDIENDGNVEEAIINLFGVSGTGNKYIDESRNNLLLKFGNKEFKKFKKRHNIHQKEKQYYQKYK